MTIKMQEIIEEIKLGKRENLYGVNFTLDEYFTDIEGVPFIEYLLKNKVKPNYMDFNKFKNNIKVAYLYAKYDEYLYSFELFEDDLFSSYDGQRYIDFFAQKDKLTNNMIESIKNHTEIIDIIIKMNRAYLCSNISPEIIQKLMTKEQDGIYPMQKYFDNQRVIKELIKLVNSPQELIELCKTNKQYELLKEANENVLMYKISENKTLLYELLEKNIIPEVLTSIPNNIEFINHLRQNNLYQYLKNAREEVLLIEVEKGETLLEMLLKRGKTLLDELIEKDITPKFNFSIFEKKTIAILHSKNRLDLVTNCSDRVLLTPIGEIFEDNSVSKDTLFIEYMLDKGYNPLSESYGISNEQIIKLLCSKGYYKFLSEKLDSKNLLMKLDDETVLIDKLIENNCNINFRYGGFEEEEIAKKLYESEKYDLLLKGKLQVLLKNIDSENTYLDYILETVKSKKIKYNLNNMDFYGCTVNTIANFYLTLAKHGMIEYVSDLDEKDLLNEYNGKTLLDELLDLDSELTIEEVIANRVKSKMKIAIILKSRGLDQKNIDVPLKHKNFTQDYLQNIENKLGIGPLLNEGEFLLKRLHDLFTTDGKSDPSLVSALVSGYRQALFVNYEINIKELRNLVELKEKNPEKFIYVKIDEGAYFKPYTGAVYSDMPIVETILHETGHALHSYLANENVPEEYSSVIERIRSNSENLKNVEMYATKCSKLRKKMNSIAEKKYELFFAEHFNKDKEAEIKEFLQKSQQEKMEEFKTLGLPEEMLDIILNNVFTSEEYIATQKRIFIKEYVDHMMRSEFGAFIAIGDILDAIYLGELNSGVLEDKKGVKINRTYGHGISYYSNSRHGFDEMVANFASISKSKDSGEMLKLLKLLVGEELYTMLSEFYYNNIVISKEEEKEGSKGL